MLEFSQGKNVVKHTQQIRTKSPDMTQLSNWKPYKGVTVISTAMQQPKADESSDIETALITPNAVNLHNMVHKDQVESPRFLQ